MLLQHPIFLCSILTSLFYIISKRDVRPWQGRWESEKTDPSDVLGMLAMLLLCSVWNSKGTLDLAVDTGDAKRAAHDTPSIAGVFILSPASPVVVVMCGGGQGSCRLFSKALHP